MNPPSRYLLVCALMLGAAAYAGPAMAATPACPGKTFAAFLSAFGASADVQRAHVAKVVSIGQIDPDADPEPRMVTTNQPGGSIDFPIMPLAAERKHDGLEMHSTPKGGGAFEVLLAAPDTGYQLRYQFRAAGSCWELVALADESM